MLRILKYGRHIPLLYNLTFVHNEDAVGCIRHQAEIMCDQNNTHAGATLSLLDRLLSVGEKNLTSDLVEQVLGMPKAQLVFDLVQEIGQNNVKSVLEQSEKIVQSGLSTDTLLASLVDHLRNLLVIRTCGPDSTLIEVPGLSMQQLQDQANQFDAVALTQDIAILEELRRTLRQTQAGRNPCPLQKL